MRIVILLFILMAAVSADAESLPWFKGNTHTHSFWSDGNDFPEMIALWYRDHGYNFLVLSDHNVLSRGERWMKLSDIRKRRAAKALPKYLSRLGEPWVEVRGEAEDRQVRLKTIDEIRRQAETTTFIMIEGEEISDRFGPHPIHTNAMNLAKVVMPPGGDSVREVMRNNILAVREQARLMNRSILPHLNHPNFHYAVTAEDIAHVVEEEFFEVFNGHPGVRDRGDEQHPSVERMWDIANTIRIATLGAAPLYGVATDDSHTYHENQNNTPGRGWIMVRAANLNAESLIQGMRRGAFYASSGVRLSDVKYDGRTLSVVVDAPSETEHTIEFIGTLDGYDSTVEQRDDIDGKAVTGRYSPDIGRVLKTVVGHRANYRFTGKELYVRAVIRSDQPPANPVYPQQRATAWTQPVGWEQRIDKARGAD